MNKLFLLLLCSCSSIYAADSRTLPPVVDNSTYAKGSAQSSATSSANAMYEILNRLEQLQLEMQELRGDVEEQSQTIMDLKKRQGNIYSDLNLRLQELAGVNIGEGVGIDSSRKNIHTGVGNSAGDSETERSIVEYPVPVNEGSYTANVVDVPAIKNQKELYQTAYDTLRNGHNTRAISAFKSLVAEFPDGEYADNAQYWLGEAYKVNQDLNSAKVAFTKVITHYAGSAKVPDALLKLGYIELEQQNVAKARDYLTQVTVSHPGTPAANLATKKLMQMGVQH